MIGALFKKQMLEAFSWLFMDRKNQKSRKTGAKIGYIVLYIFLFGYLGVMFFFMGKSLCEPLVSVGFGWLYFALIALIALVLGVIGSVFSTYSSLYGARDNDLLLSMPIPSRVILLARLSGVYVTGLLYEMMVMIPGLIVWFMYAKLTPLTVIFSILLPFVLSFLVLTLSCVLGFGVAFVSSKVRRKNLVTTVLALIFMALYMVLYSKVYDMLFDILTYADAMAGKVRSVLYPFYHMGLAAEGKPLSMLIFTAIVAVLFILAYLLVAHSFLKLATANKGAVKKKYVEKPLKTGSAKGALLRRELRRFVGSSTYMLNCGLGLVFMVLTAVLVLIYGWELSDALWLMLGTNGREMVALIAVAAVCTMGAMNDMTAPSVSLEGRQIWLIHAMPVTAWQVLCAKMKMQLLLVSAPSVLLTLAILIVLNPPIAFWFLIPLAVAVFALFMAVLGLCMNLKFHDLDWTSEIVPIKQSMAVFLTMFGSWVVVGLLGVACYLLWGLLPAAVLLLLCTLVMAFATAGMLWWMRRRGTAIFDAL